MNYFHQPFKCNAGNCVQVTDVGGSIFIHAFGAYFGLGVARMLYKEAQTENEKEGSVYHSDLFAMIGNVIGKNYCKMCVTNIQYLTFSGFDKEKSLFLSMRFKQRHAPAA